MKTYAPTTPNDEIKNERQPKPIFFYDGYTPPYTPPQNVFNIVWTIVYVFLFMTFMFCLRDKECSSQPSLVTFFFQLAFNIIWFPLLYLLRLPILALIVLIFHIAFLMTMLFFWTPPLNYLNIPFLFWSFFLLYLNTMIVLHHQRRSVVIA